MTENGIVKQIIVVNMAAPMSLGRLVAQSCHASMLSILNRGSWDGDVFSLKTDDDSFALKYWMKESFTKVACKAWGAEQMLAIKADAESRGLYVSVMEEEGHITAIALGPAESKKLEFTKSLVLL